MIEKTIGEIEEQIRGAEAVSEERKRELIQLLARLKTEVGALEKTHGEQVQSIVGFAQLSAHEATRENQNPELQALSVRGLKSSIAGFEKIASQARRNRQQHQQHTFESRNLIPNHPRSRPPPRPRNSPKIEDEDEDDEEEELNLVFARFQLRYGRHDFIGDFLVYFLEPCRLPEQTAKHWHPMNNPIKEANRFTIILTVICLAWVPAMRAAEPVYQGRAISEWLVAMQADLTDAEFSESQRPKRGSRSIQQSKK